MINRIAKFLLFAVLFVAFYSGMSCFVSSTYNQLEIVGKFEQPGNIRLYYANYLHGFSEGKLIEQPYQASNSQQTITIQLRNKSINQLKLEFKGKNDQIAIKQIALNGFFQKQPLSWNAQQIEQEFSSNNKAELIEQNSHLKLSATTGNITLSSSLLPANGSFVITWILPIALALALVLLTTNAEWKRIPIIDDLLSNQQSRNKDNFQALDGLRGIAALLVLLEHTIPEFLGAGRAGVWLFFVLSGFLLSKPFVTTPDIVLNPQKLSLYMQRRVKRIVPMFYFTITIIFLLRGHIDKALRHYLFVQGDGHFWTILHEIYFYILLPIIALACYLICRGKPLLSIIFLITLSLLWSNFANGDIVSIYGLSSHQVPYFDIFIIGMVGGYFYFGLFKQSKRLQEIAEKMKILLSGAGLISLFAFIFFASQFTVLKESFEVWIYPYLSGLICLLLILLSTSINDKSIYNRFLSLSGLRLIGIAGYSFYLLHPYAIGVTKTAISHLLAIPVHAIPVSMTVTGSLVLALLFSSFTYSYIERPFLKRSKR